MSTELDLQQSRRAFLKTIGVVGGGLILDISLSGCATTQAVQGNISKNAWQPNAWLQITPDNQIIFYLHRVEMGQGTATGLTTLIAEELKVPPEMIEVRHAQVHSDYNNPVYGIQITGGSTSMLSSWAPLREAAATARTLLIKAAAKRWLVAEDLLTLNDGSISYLQHTFSYGELTAIAKTLPIPENVTLTAPEDFKYIGKSCTRLDAAMKVMGTARYGIDSAPENAFKAAVKRCPVLGGKPDSYNADAAYKMPGVKAVFPIFNGIAVVAENYWQAKKALESISVKWDLPDLAEYSSDSIFEAFRHKLKNDSGTKVREDGAGADALEDAASVLKAEYQVPYLAHATMEPMNCSVILTSDRCEVWAPTQGPDVLAALAEEVTGLKRTQIIVHTTLMGGGFGRRLNQDFAVEAISIAKKTGLPIQLIWSREDDIQNDFYRPAVVAKLRAGIDQQGRVSTWYHKSVSPNIMAYSFQEMAGAVLPAWMPDGLVSAMGGLGDTLYNNLQQDNTSVEGAKDFYYDVENVEVRHVSHDPGLRVGFWRSVGHSFNGFIVESFVDEIAHATQTDPVEFRLARLSKHPRLKQTLEVLAKRGNWGKPSAPGLFQGVAIHPSFNSFAAQLAEVSIENNKIRVHRIACVIDCGTVVNPDIVKAQIESGINFGLTAALMGEITLKKGAVEQSNFHDYQLLRLPDSPQIDVFIISSAADPTGVGEPAVPPVAAAVANAVFAATGQRLRKLPLKLA